MKNYTKAIIFATIILFVFQMIVLKKEAERKIPQEFVAVSNYALYDIVKNLLSETKITSIKILPFGVDMHSFEPTPKSVILVQKAKVFAYSGEKLERWTKKLDLQSNAFDVSSGLHLYKTEKHLEGAADPHYWLEIENMKKITHKLALKLLEAFPKMKRIIEQNEHIYLEMLRSVDEAYTLKLQTCTKKLIVVNHNAYAYLGAKYTFKIASLHGLSPDTQENAKDLVRLIELVKYNGIQTLFVENLSSIKSMQVIQEATKTEIKTLHTLENISQNEDKNKESYESLMLQNLKKLSFALGCK